MVLWNSWADKAFPHNIASALTYEGDSIPGEIQELATELENRENSEDRRRPRYQTGGSVASNSIDEPVDHGEDSMEVDEEIEALERALIE